MNPALFQYWSLLAGFAIVAAVIASLTAAASFWKSGRMATSGQKVLIGIGFLPAPAIVLLGLFFAHRPPYGAGGQEVGSGAAFLACLALVLVQLVTPFLVWRTLPGKTTGEAFRSFAVLVLGGVAVLVDLVAILGAAQLIGGASL